MFTAPIPDDDAGRLATLRSYAILDTSPEQGYEDVTALASYICAVRYSTITFVDKDRQWFKSEFGFGTNETGRADGFCACAVMQPQTLIIEDTHLDPRFAQNPFVLGGPKIRFYAGAPLIAPNGYILGTVCVFDDKPRQLAPAQIAALEALARQVMSLLQQRKTIANLQDARQVAQATAQLIEDNERRLRIFVDTLPALAWIANADGWITWYNRRWYEYTGTSPEDMEGWGWQSVHDPNVLPLVMERWTKSIQTQQPFEMIFPLRGADGLLRSFMTRVFPVRDDSGNVLQWFGTNAEVDELQRTQRFLEESQDVLNQVLMATTDAVVSVSRDWIITYLNPAAEKLYGSTDELIGRNIWEAFPDAVYEGSPFVEHYHRAMDNGIEGSFEAEYGDPLNFTIGLEVYPAKDGIVTFSRDITQLKRATAAVMQTEKLAAVGRLASSIAHEINNPLESVTNLLYLARTTSEPALLDEYLDIAERELRRASAITNQTLRFYRQTTKALPVACTELFQETLLLYQGRLLNSNIQIEKRKRASHPAVCFEGEIRQVLSNLIGNAIDAMQSGSGRLLLRSRDATNWKTGQKGLALTIADTGTGMPPLVRKKVFEAFFTTKGIGGTGLGLWISKEIVDRHRGALHVRSSEREPTHGTVFVLFLPFEMATD
jgi:PAS domain S-box-containing protein